MERINVISRHLSVQKCSEIEVSETSNRSPPLFPNKPDDIVVVQALRTPIGKSRRGVFKDTYGDDLLSMVMNAVIDSVNIPKKDIGDICIGNVNDSKSSFTSRAAQFFSGIPDTVPVSSVNRACSSGLQAFMNIAGGIKTKSYNLGLAGGFEMMSKNALGGGDDYALNPKVMDVELARNSLIPMGITSENVAARFGITREQQDKFSMESHKKAARATKAGHFKAEIAPVTVEVTDKEGETHKVTFWLGEPSDGSTPLPLALLMIYEVSQDEGIRGNTTMELLSKLRPAFQKGGSTTAGNSSQTSDGAAAVLVASRREAEARNLPVLGTLRAFAVKGCPPDIMGIGPAIAIPEALKKAGLTIDDIDIFEINEAFASQAVYCVEKLGIPAEKVNPKGGAIALGHPLGCTGARMIGTLLHEMKRRGKRGFGIVSMCMGTGMGAAAIYEYNP